MLSDDKGESRLQSDGDWKGRREENVHWKFLELA